MKGKKTPHLVVCKVCGKHGHFSLPDGDDSPEFYTVEKALDMISEYHRVAILHGSEASMLSDQVKNSGVQPFDYFLIDVLAQHHSLLDEMEEVPEDEGGVIGFLEKHHEFEEGNCILITNREKSDEKD